MLGSLPKLPEVQFLPSGLSEILLFQGIFCGSLYLPKVALISPIPYPLLQCDLTTPFSREGVDFSAPLSLGRLSDILEQ